MEFVSIDFETANEKRSSPCAIGVVVANKNGIVDEYYSLINPLMEFSPYNTYVHGITENDVADAPTFPELWPALHNYLAHNLVIAHNASFDMSVIRHTLDRFDLQYPDLEYLCTANISKRVWPDLHNHKLNTLADHHHIMFEHHHALEDARVAAKVFLKAIEEYEVGSVEMFLQKCKIAKGRIYERGYVPPKSKAVKRSSKIRLF
ncbi:3'-5' exonuclease [Virgibacillus oceani]|uniref:DNA polymerase III subunit epsilon n=1 Tax=Virgibacillus oceani TaxID=1479511 RepID=A0A917HSA6_9BACI|nr:3'-5' exonuclease [Virgibacillus oceani]GGG88556.1 DNA polymerase III subunit epsilon [Virgibacillus oceani]